MLELPRGGGWSPRTRSCWKRGAQGSELLERRYWEPRVRGVKVLEQSVELRGEGILVK